MGVARLLAKAWVVICLYAGALEIVFVLHAPADPFVSLPPVLVCMALFAAMGLLFVGGYGASTGYSRIPLYRRIKSTHFVPNFNETVFAVFAILSFVDQIYFAPAHLSGLVVDALEAAIQFAVPGQRALLAALAPCAVDGGRVFASSFTWLLAIIFLASALSRLRLAAGILRLERVTRPEALGPALLALVLGILALAGVQLLFIGSAYAFLPCSLFTGISGGLLIGLAPLMLSYLIVAALASLLASGHEK